MSKDVLITEDMAVIEKLEDKIRELENANLRLQQYFAKASVLVKNKKEYSPFSGYHSFNSSLRFVIDIQLQKLVWINLEKNSFIFKPEKLFLLDVEPLSGKLIAPFDRKRFQDIINQYSEDFQEPMQTILRVNHSNKNFVWVLARFEKVVFLPESKGVLQVEFIMLDETAEISNLCGEFFKKLDREEQYQRIENLTKRQREILVLLGKGLTSKEIANHLNISFHTVEAHRKIIAQKTKTKKRAALICLAAEVGLIN